MTSFALVMPYYFLFSSSSTSVPPSILHPISSSWIVKLALKLVALFISGHRHNLHKYRIYRKKKKRTVWLLPLPRKPEGQRWEQEQQENSLVCTEFKFGKRWCDLTYLVACSHEKSSFNMSMKFEVPKTVTHPSYQGQK